MQVMSVVQSATEPLTGHALETRAALAQLWRDAGFDAAALDYVDLTGTEPVLPSSFAVGTAAQATIAAAALAAAEIWRMCTGRRQRVAVDMRRAAIEFRSEHYVSVDGRAPEAIWDHISGLYRCGDGRWIRLHSVLPHHRAGLIKLLGCSEDKAGVQRALDKWQAEALETAAAEAGLVATASRSFAEWDHHPQGRAVAQLPLFGIDKIGEAPPHQLAAGARPLAGLRVLDLTRIIAGPVCGRTLAVHGADVMLITAGHLPSVPSLVIDTGRGKLSAALDLRESSGRDTLTALLRDADIFIQGYRPGAIAARGFSPQQAARIRPAIIYVSLCAYGHEGPWAERRGFDSLVQNANGLNDAEALAFGAGEDDLRKPLPLPAQALDHGAGYLLAFAALAALKRRIEEGGSWHVRLSLAQTGLWLRRLGRIDGMGCHDPGLADVADCLVETDSGFGRLRAVRHAADMSETQPYWARPSVPLGADPPVWPR
jgi:crotonobetainyl-CoA:carnitine CoA-transferase CaiB-like acyl-CoA transferase